jgi:hypothetical protein
MKNRIKNTLKNLGVYLALLWFIVGLSNFPIKDGGLAGGLLNLWLQLVALVVLIAAGILGTGIYLWVK